MCFSVCSQVGKIIPQVGLSSQLNKTSTCCIPNVINHNEGMLTVLFELFSLSSLLSFIAYGNSYSLQTRDTFDKQTVVGELDKSPSKTWTLTQNPFVSGRKTKTGVGIWQESVVQIWPGTWRLGRNNQAL